MPYPFAQHVTFRELFAHLESEGVKVTLLAQGRPILEIDDEGLCVAELEKPGKTPIARVFPAIDALAAWSVVRSTCNALDVDPAPLGLTLG
ncbi:MAG TPA: hypothetical protein VFF73_28055 [Planctomycetota bacterium]|nr:hypothetical protein [Planctomycetota bacterium]